MAADKFKTIRDWSGWITALLAFGFPTAGASLTTWLASLAPSAPPPILLLGVFVGSFAAILGLTLWALRRRGGVGVPVMSGLTTVTPENKTDPQPEVVNDVSQAYFRGRSIRIADLAEIEPILTDRVFEDCYIFGPAVLLLMESVQLYSPIIHAERVEDVLYVATPPRQMTGVIGLQRCTFRRCVFHGIGFMSSQEIIDAILAAEARSRAEAKND